MTGLAAIDAVDVSRIVGDRRVLDSVNLRVERGEVFGVIGRNGAGKTTLLECISGQQRATSGHISVLGLDPVRDRRALTSCVAVLAQATALLPTLTVSETLDLFSSFYSHPRPTDEIITALDLGGLCAQRVGRLSGGEARRLQVALALVPHAELVLLDEPSAAIDPHGRVLTQRIVRALAEDGVTVVLSTHDMTEAEQWCDRVAVVEQGQITALGVPAELIAQHQGRAIVRFSLDEHTDASAVKTAARGETVSIEPADGRLRVEIETADVDALVRRLTFTRNIKISGLAIERRGLSQIYFGE